MKNTAFTYISITFPINFPNLILSVEYTSTYDSNVYSELRALENGIDGDYDCTDRVFHTVTTAGYDSLYGNRSIYTCDYIFIGY